MASNQEHPNNNKRFCHWGVDDDGVWDTMCGKQFAFTEGGPRDNEFKFCPYCGGIIALDIVLEIGALGGG